MWRVTDRLQDEGQKNQLWVMDWGYRLTSVVYCMYPEVTFPPAAYRHFTRDHQQPHTTACSALVYGFSDSRVWRELASVIEKLWRATLLHETKRITHAINLSTRRHSLLQVFTVHTTLWRWNNTKLTCFLFSWRHKQSQMCWTNGEYMHMV